MPERIESTERYTLHKQAKVVCYYTERESWINTSKIREIMALLSPLYHAEMLKNAKVQVS